MGRDWYNIMCLIISVFENFSVKINIFFLLFNSTVAESGSNSQSKNQSHWVKRTSLVDSRTNVTDIKFAPKHMGLLLAMCSADGGVRSEEC